jgi:hypothetical protein
MLSDSLVLRIDELDTENENNNNNNNKIDTKLFIVYDHVDKCFVLRGRRYNPTTNFSYYCNKHFDVVNLLNFLFCEKNKFNYVLYSHNNLPYYSDNITFDFLEKNMVSKHEISGYDNQPYDLDQINSLLRILKKIYN